MDENSHDLSIDHSEGVILILSFEVGEMFFKKLGLLGGGPGILAHGQKGGKDSGEEQSGGKKQMEK